MLVRETSLKPFSHPATQDTGIVIFPLGDPGHQDTAGADAVLPGVGAASGSADSEMFCVSTQLPQRQLAAGKAALTTISEHSLGAQLAAAAQSGGPPSRGLNLSARLPLPLMGGKQSAREPESQQALRNRAKQSSKVEY